MSALVGGYILVRFVLGVAFMVMTAATMTQPWRENPRRWVCLMLIGWIMSLILMGPFFGA